MKNLCVVIPTLNSAGHIRATVASAFIALDSCGVGGDFEIVAVDDGSSDETLAVLEDLARNESRLKVVGLARNFGQHAAIFAGCNYSSSKVVLFTDDDMVLTPERIDALFSGIQRGADVVLGVDDSRHRSVFRRITSGFYNKLMRSSMGFSSDAAFSNLWMANALTVRQMSGISFPFANVMGVVAHITSTSLLLLVIGVIGEYVGRMFSSSTGRPIYVVRSVANI
jgi:glycosyltransferase involved in cell wall biosynthesis